MWIYPNDDQIAYEGDDNLASYTFKGSGIWQKSFCKTCGVHLSNRHVPMTVQEAAALPDEAQAFYHRTLGWHPITVRSLNDFDFRKLKTRQANGYNGMGREYQNP